MFVHRGVVRVHRYNRDRRCQRRSLPSCALLTQALLVIVALAVPSVASAYSVAAGSAEKIYIKGSFYDDPLPTNSACATGNGGTANGSPCWFNYASGSATPLIPEVPPFLVIKGGWYQYLISSAQSYYCFSPNSLSTATNPATPIDCTSPSINTMVANGDSYYHTPSAIPRYWPGTTIARDYRRNYHGVYSATTVSLNGTMYDVGLDHGEDKNEDLYNGSSSGYWQYQNTVAPSETAASCSWPDGGSNFPSNNCAVQSSSDECPGDLPWFSADTPDALCNYFGFISSSTQVSDSADNWGDTWWDDSNGPIVWPSAGYLLSDGQPASRGVRHPYIFSPGNGYLYMYYLDTTPGAWGIDVARSPASSLAAAGSWEVYDPATEQFDFPALPSGLTGSNYTSYYDVEGPQTSPIVGEASGYMPLTWQVAALSTAVDGYSYAAVSEWVEPSTNSPFAGVTSECAAMALSTDMIHWTAPACIPNGSNEYYPVLLNSNESTSETVSPDGFYVESSINSVPHLQQVSITG